VVGNSRLRGGMSIKTNEWGEMPVYGCIGETEYRGTEGKSMFNWFDSFDWFHWLTARDVRCRLR
jgi:hypothetical protein